MSENLTDGLTRLDRLVRLCKEASYELDLAKNHLRDPHLQAILTVGIAGHAGAARRFEDRITAGERAAGVTLAADSGGEAVWADMSGAVARGEPEAILRVCEIGEEHLRSALKDVADDADLDEASRAAALRHLEEVTTLCGNLRSAREAVEYRLR